MTKLISAVVSLLILTAASSRAATTLPPAKAQVDQLVAVIKSDASEKQKADACRELARVGTKDAVGALAALLPDEKLSHMARYGLETIPDPSVDKAFRETLSRLQGRQLAGVIASIGVRRDTKAVPALAKLLRSDDPDVAQAAARSLGRIATPAAASALQKALSALSSQNQLAFCEGLFRCAEQLARAGKTRQARALYEQVRASTSMPHQVRAAALRGALLTAQNDCSSLLSDALRSQDFSMFAAALRASRELPGPEVTHVLTSQLPGLPADNKILLIQTLAWRSDPAALPTLLEAAKASDKAVRLAALKALPGFGDASTIPVLSEAMTAPDPEFAQTAQEGFASLPGAGPDQVIMNMFASDNDSKRSLAADLMVRRRMTAALPVLLKAAQSTDQKLRSLSLSHLGELAGPAEIPPLLELLSKASTPADLEGTEQALSSVSLKAANPAECAAKIAARLPQDQAAQTCALLRVLTALGGDEGLNAVRATLKDSTGEVRAAAVRALSNWNQADAAPDLLELARTADANEKMLSLRGYLRLASQPELPADKRLAMCREVAPLVQTDEQKKLLLAALSGIPLADSLTLIQPYLDDSATREEAGNAAVNVSEKLLQSKDAAGLAARLVDPLNKIAQGSASEDLVKRAKNLLEEARKKAAGN